MAKAALLLTSVVRSFSRPAKFSIYVWRPLSTGKLVSVAGFMNVFGRIADNQLIQRLQVPGKSVRIGVLYTIELSLWPEITTSGKDSKIYHMLLEKLVHSGFAGSSKISWNIREFRHRLV